MSSGGNTDEVDSLVLVQNHHEKQGRRNSPKIVNEQQKLSTNNSTNSKFKKGTQRGIVDNNHAEKKSKLQDGQMKELSFFPGDDESDGSSSPLNLKMTRGIANNNEELAKRSANDKTRINTEDVVQNKSPINAIEDDTTEKPLNSDQNGDASSTSSCSCEDHSSVANPSERDDHEDLDYDEDSISDSLPATSNTTQEPTHSSSSSSINNKLELCERISASKSDLHMRNLDNAHTSSVDNSNNQNRNATKKQHNSRIKSVINLDHDDDCIIIDSPNTEKVTNDKSRKSYECLLKYFFKDACYFQIKSINHENVELSKSMGVWSTPVQNEIRLNTAFREHRNVILIFSVQQSGGFQGFARMVSESRPTTRVVPWVLPERLSKKSLGGVLRVEWLCTKELPFHETHDLYNPYNDNKPIKVARDGQQVEPKIGKKLCKLFPRDSKETLLSSLATLKHQTSQRKKSSSRHDNFYPLTDRRGYIEDRHRQTYITTLGTNGLGEPGVPNNISHDYLYNSHGKGYRPIGRRRIFDHLNHGPYHRQELYQNHHGSPRSNHMARNMDMIPRCPMPGIHEDFHQAYGLPPAHHYPNTLGMWGPHPDMIRYHPYQRPRR